MSVSVAATVLALTACVAPASAASQPCGDLAVAPPLHLEHIGQAAPAGPFLRQLASRLRPAAEDQQTGRYAQVHLALSGADSAFEPCVQTTTAYARERRWRADDGSGQVVGTAWHTDLTNPPPVTSTTYRRGRLTGVVPGPVPTDPARLAAALDAYYPPQLSLASRLRAVADLAGWHYSGLDARRSVLTVLAQTHGLRYRGIVAGFPGVAVTIDTANVRDVLVLDRRTGAVLAYELVLLADGQAMGVRTPYSNTRTLYIGRGRTDRLGQAARL
ncbi:hypothetical protein WEI85_07465 [Actinomycetes bacterium KLBMP 9797]